MNPIQNLPICPVLLLAGLLCKPLEKFQDRVEINTDSDQAHPVTAHFTASWNEDQFVLIALENS